MSSGCNKKIIKWRSPGREPWNPDSYLPPHTELRMNTTTAHVAALAFAIVLATTACKPSGEAQAPAGDAGTPTAAPAGDKVAVQITGAGATFIYPLISKWSDDYNKATGAKVNYQSIGSGGGIAQ